MSKKRKKDRWVFFEELRVQTFFLTSPQSKILATSLGQQIGEGRVKRSLTVAGSRRGQDKFTSAHVCTVIKIATLLLLLNFLASWHP